MWQYIMRSLLIVSIPETLYLQQAPFIFILSPPTGLSCKRFTHSSPAFIREVPACLLYNKKSFDWLHHIKNLHVTEELLQLAY